MPSSTSSSERLGLGSPQQHSPLRDIPQAPWPRILWAAVLVCAVLLGAWEAYWRSEWFVPSIRNSDGLWALTRTRIETEGGHGTVVVSSSRLLFDLHLEAWREETGQLPIQLGLEGTSPRPFLSDVARDTAFKGLVVVGVTPPLFFPPPRGERLTALAFAKQWSPADQFGQQLSMRFVEPVFAFYDPDTALFTVLKRQPFWPQRPGLPPQMPKVRKLANTRSTRQSDMWEKVERDPAYQKIARDTWLAFINAPRPPLPPPEVLKKGFEALLAEVAGDVRRIRERGGEVVFVRAPSSGPFLAAENGGFPRERTWDPLLQATNAVGIHFEDHADLRDVELPEWSHISAGDTDRFTRALVRHLREALVAKGTPRQELGR